MVRCGGRVQREGQIALKVDSCVMMFIIDSKAEQRVREGRGSDKEGLSGWRAVREFEARE
jgi:hypothetical protein